MAREPTTSFEQVGLAMGDPSVESGSSEGDRTSTCMLSLGGVGNAAAASETSMWEEWTQGTSAGDEVSTSNFLPELTSSTTGRLSFQQSDMLATWMSTFHPLAQSSLSPDLTTVDVAASFMHEPGLALDPSHLEIDGAAHAFPLGYDKATAHRKLGPLSPSSPLAFQNGLPNVLGDPSPLSDDPWDSSPSALQWSTVTATGQTYNNSFGHDARSSFIPDHSSTAIEHLESMTATTRYTSALSSGLSRPRHTDIFIGPNGTFESSTPGGWTPQLMYDAVSETTVESSVTPMKLMASLREAGEATSGDVCGESKPIGEGKIGLIRRDGERIIHRPVISEPTSTVTMSSILADCQRSGAESSLTTQVVWPGKHRLELVELVDGEEDTKSSSPPLLKRPKMTSVEYAKLLQWSDQTLRGAELRSYCGGSRSSSSCSSRLLLAASQAMDIIAIGPALNTNGKPRARRGSATDPQSVYARHRREKINERLKNLQKLVPNGAKVDIVTMLDEAIHYVKFLQNQLELLKSDDYWMYANPTKYNGMDLSDLCPYSQELESSAS